MACLEASAYPMTTYYKCRSVRVLLPMAPSVSSSAISPSQSCQCVAPLVKDIEPGKTGSYNYQKSRYIEPFL